MREYQKGFAHLIIIVVFLLVGILGFFAWEFLGADVDDDNDVLVNKAPGVSADCGAELFDSHTHLDDSDLPTDLAVKMQENDVTCAVIFVQLNPDRYEDDRKMLYDDLGSAKNVYIPFLDVIRNRSTKITTSYLQDVYDEFEGKFRGFGEFALYREELSGTDLTSEPWNTIFEFAGEHDLFVMIHVSPNPQELAGLKSAMVEYPNTKFLIHGFELGGEGYAQLLKEYPNFYFTLDTATLLKEAALGPGIHLMYPASGGGARQFLSEYNENSVRFLEQAKNEWSQVIVAAPDRVMWGTDVSFDWHVDPEVYKKLIEFSKDFIRFLPADVRDKYAYKNAVRLFGPKAVVFDQVEEDDSDLDYDDENQK